MVQVVKLIGGAGTGKTREAAEAAERAADHPGQGSAAVQVETGIASRSSGERSTINKAFAKSLQGDYAPGGTPVATDECTHWRMIGDNEVERCGRLIGYDVQSGPVYCGDVADFGATAPNGEPVFICARHVSQSAAVP